MYLFLQKYNFFKFKMQNGIVIVSFEVIFSKLFIVVVIF